MPQGLGTSFSAIYCPKKYFQFLIQSLFVKFHCIGKKLATIFTTFTRVHIAKLCLEINQHLFWNFQRNTSWIFGGGYFAVPKKISKYTLADFCFQFSSVQKTPSKISKSVLWETIKYIVRNFTQDFTDGFSKFIFHLLFPDFFSSKRTQNRS